MSLNHYAVKHPEDYQKNSEKRLKRKVSKIGSKYNEIYKLIYSSFKTVTGSLV